MAPPLPKPKGTPDRPAKAIMASIERYLASAKDESRGAVDVSVGLRHILWHADKAWDESLVVARDRGAYYREITDVTGDLISTLQNHIARHRARQAGTDDQDAAADPEEGEPAA